MAKILVVTANGNTPATRLQLGSEERNIRGALLRGSNFSVLNETDATCEALVHRLVVEKPHILHFAGHGVADNGEAAIQLTNSDGRLQVMGDDSLTTLFSNLRPAPTLVFLNSCYSANQAATLIRYVDIVIGVQRTVRDSVAREFAATFYRILASSYPVQNAFDLARTAIDPEDRFVDQFLLSAKDGVRCDQVSFLGRPELVAQFNCDENGPLVSEDGRFNVSLALLGADDRIEHVTYQLCNETSNAPECRFWEVSRSRHKRFSVERVYIGANYTARVTVWSAGEGIAFEETVCVGLERHYGLARKTPKIMRAIATIRAR